MTALTEKAATRKCILFFLATVCTIPVLLSILRNQGYLLALTTLKRSSPAGHSLFSQPNKGARCILYDRPPRTGSTTVSRTLDVCLRARGYTVLPGKGANTERETVITRLQSNAAVKKASVMQHLYMTADDLRNLQASCGQLLYISSVARMSDRLLSMVKYSTFDGHGNASVPLNNLTENLRWIRKRLEKPRLFYTEYPFVGEGKRMLPAATRVSEEMRRELGPNYVLRKDNLVYDLRDLLDALECEDVAVTSMNVHEVVGDTDDGGQEEGVRKLIEQVFDRDDVRYRSLMKEAAHNKEGLQLARSFAR